MSSKPRNRVTGCGLIKALIFFNFVDRSVFVDFFVSFVLFVSSVSLVFFVFTVSLDNFPSLLFLDLEASLFTKDQNYKNTGDTRLTLTFLLRDFRHFPFEVIRVLSQKIPFILRR